MKVFTLVSDEGCGWVQVPLDDLKAIDAFAIIGDAEIDRDPSFCSRMTTRHVYVEADDTWPILKAYAARRGEKMEINPVIEHCASGPAPMRAMLPYQAEAARAGLTNIDLLLADHDRLQVTGIASVNREEDPLLYGIQLSTGRIETVPAERLGRYVAGAIVRANEAQLTDEPEPDQPSFA